MAARGTSRITPASIAGVAGDARRVDLYDEAGPTPVAGIKYSNMGLYKSRKLNVTTPPGLHHHRALYDCYITAALLLDIINVSGWTQTKWPISPDVRR